MVTSSKTKVGTYVPIEFQHREERTKKCEVHGLFYEVAKGCTVCRVNPTPDPKR